MIYLSFVLFEVGTTILILRICVIALELHYLPWVAFDNLISMKYMSYTWFQIIVVKKKKLVYYNDEDTMIIKAT